MKHPLILLAFLAIALPAHADSDHDAARRALERGEVLALAEILAIVGRD
ncbi:MAG: peptidase, partial [Alphaproteobacteria bacterium HGW-Alphaproteobacteria-8]